MDGLKGLKARSAFWTTPFGVYGLIFVDRHMIKTAVTDLNILSFTTISKFLTLKII